MEKIKSWELITNLGKKVRKGWDDLANNNGLKIIISGIPAISSYSFSNNNLKYKTYVTQEMLKKGFLASTDFYSCIAHKESHLDNYFDHLGGIFSIISKCEKDQLNIDDLLEGPVCHNGFYRLN